MLGQLGKKVHIIGIGGARLSALAKILHSQGYQITGSDASESRFTEAVRRLGITIQAGHEGNIVEQADWVVYTTAVGESNPELVKARRLNLPVLEGSELLGLLMGAAETGVAIAGTHGKTTTTGMTALALMEAGVDPTIVIGGDFDPIGGNARIGGKNVFLAEACEFREAFLRLKPTIGVITNIDWDHPDCFPTLESVAATFRKFVALLPPNGTLIVCGDDPLAAGIAAETKCRTLKYGFGAGNDLVASELSAMEPLGQTYQLSMSGGRGLGTVTLSVPGRHNVLNSLGSLAVCHALGLDLAKPMTALAAFRGVHRRFEIKGHISGITIVDDYAHHPSAARLTLATAREHFKGRIWCVFQPHLYSRTKYLFNELANAFGDADHVVFTDIYAAREADPGDISSVLLAQEAAKHHPAVHYFGGLQETATQLVPLLKPGDLVITMGAGDITNLSGKLLAMLA
jgi:UDP-N-acetylmuramate--alanine ligase